MIGRRQRLGGARQRLKNYLENKILRFAVVGGGATIVHLAVATSLVRSFPGMSIFHVNAVAFSVAVFVSFIGHSVFTFKAKGSLVRFVATAVVGLGCNNIVAYALLWATDIKLLSIATGTLAAPVVVYILSSFWVFTIKKTDT